MTCYFYLACEAAHQEAEKARLSCQLSNHTVNRWVHHGSNEVQSNTHLQYFQNLVQTLKNGDTLIVERLQDFGCGPLEAISLIKTLMSRSIGIVVLEIDERDLATQENSTVAKMLEAITSLDPSAFVLPSFRSTESACRARRKNEDLVRETIITKYSLGESVTSIAREYNVSRSAIARIVQPARTYEPLYQRAFGD